MKQQKRANQIQLLLLDELRLNDAPSLVEVPADRALELEAAVGELLRKTFSQIDCARGGDHDA
jgi:hypothetical protein